MFGAGAVHGEDFAGVGEAGLVEDLFDEGLGGEVFGGVHQWQQVEFLDPDAVLAGDGAAKLDAFADNVFASFHNPLDHAGFAVIEVEAGVEVAVSGVEDVGDADVVLGGDGVDEVEHLWEFGAGDDAIVGDDGGGKAAHGSDALLSGRPELGALLGIGGFDKGEALVVLADRANGFHFLLDGSFVEAIAFDEEKGLGGFGELETEGGVDGVHDSAIHHLQRGGDGAPGDDFGDGLGGLADGLEGDEGGSDLGRDGGEFDPGFGDDSEEALGATDDAEEVVAGTLAMLAPNGQDFTLGVDHGDAEDVLDGDAVLEGVGSTGVFGDVAAEGAH